MTATPGVLTAVADKLEDQWDRLVPSEIAGDRVVGKSKLKRCPSIVHGCAQF